MLPDMQSSNPLARMLALYDAVSQLVDEARSSNGLFQRVTVGSGGMVFKDGGGIELLDGGDITARGGSISSVHVETGAIAQLSRARVYFASNLENPLWGYIGADPGGDNGYLRMLAPGEPDVRSRNSITIKGTDSEPGAVWVYTDGRFQVSADDLASLEAGRWNILTGGEFGLYELPTTSAAANLHLGTVGGQWTAAYITSSRRYKQDIEDLAVDPKAVLEWRPRSWRDKNDVAAVGDEAKRHVGFIAEEVEEAGTECFVTRDEDGQTDGLLYDRMTIGLHAVARDHEDRIVEVEKLRTEVADLRDENAALESKLADVLARLDALEEA